MSATRLARGGTAAPAQRRRSAPPSRAHPPPPPRPHPPAPAHPRPAATLGFNIECVEYKKLVFSLWDLGGSHDARGFWRFYYEDTQAIIFVIDSSDLERMDDAREDLHRMLTEHELWDAPLLVLANKQDAPRAASTREITEYLQLFSLTSRNWYIINTKAVHPDAAEANLHAGLDWLVEVLLMPAAKRQEKAKADHKNMVKHAQAASGG